MLLLLAGNNMHNAATLGGAGAPAPAVSTLARQSNPLLASVGRLMVRLVPFLLIAVS